jgi:phenylpropionate dioxygenase-like ring-hydroxylating dioxygenase large terminal subunit
MADIAEVQSDTKMLLEIVRGVPAGLELGLRNYWYPIVQSSELPAGSPIGITCLGEDLVLYRDSNGPKVLFDRCPHRYVKLSVGRVFGDELQCAFHGLRFDGTGACTLIPWEQPMDQAIRQKLCVRSYKAAEVGGIVWAYLGDEKQFPAPPIEHCLPEELLQPDKFVHFLHPTEIWDANWLLVLDGGDAYHAVTLHVASQQHDAVLEYLDRDTVSQLAGRKEQTLWKPVPLADRRVRIVETDGHGLRGMSVDLEGNHLDHGHELTSLKGERFNLPGLITNALRPVDNAAPYVSRLFQVPVNYNQTRLFRYAAWRAEGQEERVRLKQHFEAVVKPRQLKTSAEDRMMASVSGDLVESRRNELLLAPDRDMIRIRRRIAAEFTSQKLSGRRAPEDDMTPSPETLVFPV